jgi:urease accessory protein
MPLNARLHIETGLQEGRTILRKSYCTQPFKLANITEDKQQKELHLMLMSSSPGVLDGDVYSLQIAVAAASHLHLQTQSYQRLFQMKQGAVQRLTASLDEGSSLHYIPHPVVPHLDAIFSSKTSIHIATGCRLIWGDVISCGRKLNGEVFQFTSLHSLTEVFCRGKLVVKENLLLRPGVINLTGIGHLEGYTHQATLLFIDDNATIPLMTTEVLALLEAEANITFGVSALPVNGLAVRLLGHKAEQLYGLLQLVAALLKTAESASVEKPVTHDR